MSDHVPETIFSSDISPSSRRGSSVPSWLQHKDLTQDSGSSLTAETSEVSPSNFNSNTNKQSSLFSVFPSRSHSPPSDEQSPSSLQHKHHDFSDNESESDFDQSSCSEEDFDSPSTMQDMSLNTTPSSSSGGGGAEESPIWARQQSSSPSLSSSAAAAALSLQSQQQQGRDVTVSSLVDTDAEMEMEIASTTDSTSSFNGYSTRT